MGVALRSRSVISSPPWTPSLFPSVLCRQPSRPPARSPSWLPDSESGRAPFRTGWPAARCRLSAAAPLKRPLMAPCELSSFGRMLSSSEIRMVSLRPTSSRSWPRRAEPMSLVNKSTDMSGFHLSLGVLERELGNLPARFWVPVTMVEGDAEFLGRSSPTGPLGWICFESTGLIGCRALFVATALRSASDGLLPPRPVVTPAELLRRGVI